MDRHTMKSAFVLVALSFLAGSATANWQQVWSDEFNGNSLNENDWVYDTGCDGFGLVPKIHQSLKTNVMLFVYVYCIETTKNSAILLTDPKIFA